jgi:AAA domain
VTIHELQQQRRWVLWRLETVNGKETKIPYQSDGRKAKANDPATWSTHAECMTVVSGFSGVGVVLGSGIVGVDFDKCCDAALGKFSPESREIVIGLDSYGEYSQSGEGAHVLCLADFPEEYRGINTGKKGDSIVRPMLDFKQIEIKGSGFYFVVTGRHLSKTPLELMPRQQQINALCKRIAGIAHAKPGLAVAGNEEERFCKLMAGDFSDYAGDLSRADLGLCNILARRLNNDVWKIADAWMSSPLYRDKLERTDYRSSTILKAIKGEPIFDATDCDPVEDDGVDEYVVNALTPKHEGWFPKGDQSLVGGASGSGKTYWVMTLLEKVRLGAEVWGHKTQPRDYRVLMIDRGAPAMRRTLDRLGASPEARKRIIRVTGAQQARGPVAVLTESMEREPGVEVWFVEGLDMWIQGQGKMDAVAPVLDNLQRLAARRKVALIYSVGSSKEKSASGKNTERYHGRDVVFGSVAWARKAETVVIISLTDAEDDNSARQYSVLVRNGQNEKLWMEFTDGELRLVAKPEQQQAEVPKASAMDIMHENCITVFKPGEQVVYRKGLGARATFFRWRDQAFSDGILVRSDGLYYRGHTGT